MADEKEVEKTEEVKVEEPVKPAQETQQAEDMISKANVAAARLEAGNKELAELIAKQERLKVEATLGGTADAGQQEKSEEQKAIDSAKKLIEGTGFESMLDPNDKDK